MTECQHCKTDSKGTPCALPRSAHREDIEIHEGPNREGQYVFTRWWWREDTRRQRAQVFLAEPPTDVEWRAAWIAYRKKRVDL